MVQRCRFGGSGVGHLCCRSMTCSLAPGYLALLPLPPSDSLGPSLMNNDRAGQVALSHLSRTDMHVLCSRTRDRELVFYLLYTILSIYRLYLVGEKLLILVL